MSAFMTSPESIALIAAAALSHIPVLRREHKNIPERGATTLLRAFNRLKTKASEAEQVSFGDLATALARMNMDSLHQRYPDKDSMYDPGNYGEEELLKCTKEYRKEELLKCTKEYRKELILPSTPEFFDISRGRLLEVCKAIDCFLYQCSEGDVPDTNPLFRGCREFKAKLAEEYIETSLAYNEAPWG